MFYAFGRAFAAVVAVAAAAPLSAGAAWAQQTAPAFDGADTAWMLTATALVLFMTMPGLALFYGGLVRVENVLSVLMQCFAIGCLASVLWLVGVYSLAFDGGGPVIGGLSKMLLSGVGWESASGDLPETVFFMFQMTFAIITPALIVGAYVERIRFSFVLLFSALWLALVYAPAAHWVWGGGWLADLGVMDFAGGLVVHASAGASSVVLALALGPRRGFPGDVRPPHNPGMTMTGACMLWVGWYGFNAGSALAADANAGMALTVTHISASTAALTWMAIEWIKHGKPSLIGAVTGLIAGLATITPASGFVGPIGGLVFGLLAGVVCYVAVGFMKARLRVDDTLDVFAVHGVGGVMGTLLTAVFAAESLGGAGLADGVSMGRQAGVQLIGVAAVVAWAAVASVIITVVVKAAVGLRVDAEDETEGLDLASHGERAHNL